MCYIPDNYDRWKQHDTEQEEALELLPECDMCGKRIQEEHCYQINDELICESCMDDYRVCTMDLIG